VLILKIRGLRQTKPEKICSMMKIQARTGLAFALGFLLTIPTLEALPFGAAGCSGGQAAVGKTLIVTLYMLNRATTAFATLFVVSPHVFFSGRRDRGLFMV
jgi:hypothetical protein